MMLESRNALKCPPHNETIKTFPLAQNESSLSPWHCAEWYLVFKESKNQSGADSSMKSPSHGETMI